MTTKNQSNGKRKQKVAQVSANASGNARRKRKTPKSAPPQRKTSSNARPKSQQTAKPQRVSLDSLAKSVLRRLPRHLTQPAPSRRKEAHIDPGMVNRVEPMQVHTYHAYNHKVHHNGKGKVSDLSMTIRACESMGAVTGAGTIRNQSDGHLIWEEPLNPLTLNSQKTRRLAAMYTSFRFKSFKVHFVSSKGTNQTGSFIAGYIPDPNMNPTLVPDIAKLTSLENRPGGLKRNVYQHWSWTVPLKEGIEFPKKDYLCKIESTTTDQDYFQGRIHIMEFNVENDLITDRQVYGRLYYEYEVELIGMDLESLMTSTEEKFSGMHTAIYSKFTFNTGADPPGVQLGMTAGTVEAKLVEDLGGESGIVEMFVDNDPSDANDGSNPLIGQGKSFVAQVTNLTAEAERIIHDDDPEVEQRKRLEFVRKYGIPNTAKTRLDEPDVLDLILTLFPTVMNLLEAIPWNGTDTSLGTVVPNILAKVTSLDTSKLEDAHRLMAEREDNRKEVERLKRQLDENRNRSISVTIPSPQYTGSSPQYAGPSNVSLAQSRQPYQG